jgi:hypothetical protein
MRPCLAAMSEQFIECCRMPQKTGRQIRHIPHIPAIVDSKTVEKRRRMTKGFIAVKTVEALRNDGSLPYEDA